MHLKITHLLIIIIILTDAIFVLSCFTFIYVKFTELVFCIDIFYFVHIM